MDLEDEVEEAQEAGEHLVVRRIPSRIPVTFVNFVLVQAVEEGVVISSEILGLPIQS